MWETVLGPIWATGFQTPHKYALRSINPTAPFSPNHGVIHRTRVPVMVCASEELSVLGPGLNLDAVGICLISSEVAFPSSRE